MKKYRVILADNKANTGASGALDDADGLIFGLIGEPVKNTAVRLARSASHVSGSWEISLNKFVVLGVATAGLVGGPLSGEAQASEMNTLSLPQIQENTATFVPWNGLQVEDNSAEAVRSLEQVPLFSQQHSAGRLIAAGGMHSNGDYNHSNTGPHTNGSGHTNGGAHTNTGGHTNGGHSNGGSGHNNTVGSHTNNDWTNHTNNGHSNGPWWNHVNSGNGHTNGASDYEFGHVNMVQGDYIF